MTVEELKRVIGNVQDIYADCNVGLYLERARGSGSSAADGDRGVRVKIIEYGKDDDFMLYVKEKY